MAEPLKNLYNPPFFDAFTGILNRTIPGFDEKAFLEMIYDSDWEHRELKDRMKHIATTLDDFFPDDYEQAVSLIKDTIPEIQQSSLADCRLEFMFFPEYVERFGLNQFDVSVDAIEFITTFTSCEFAVRPFITEYPDRMMNRMLEWSGHENHHVRRLASEGCRPRLPWSMALNRFKINPEPVLPILENLKEDSSEYVRRSVANNLNDIAKDHPGLVLQIAGKWKGTSAKTDRILKHGCRTLLKQGHPDALNLFGFQKPDNVPLTDFSVQPSVKKGKKLDFSFSLQNSGDQPAKLRVEYGIDYRKANGSLNRKIFKITEYQYYPGEKVSFSRSQSFRDLTTRKHYPGEHRLAVIVNGQEMGVKVFEVVE
jgi:3-methyladenine DNA glycosylase AlkC